MPTPSGSQDTEESATEESVNFCPVCNKEFEGPRGVAVHRGSSANPGCRISAGPNVVSRLKFSDDENFETPQISPTGSILGGSKSPSQDFLTDPTKIDPRGEIGGPQIISHREKLQALEMKKLKAEMDALYQRLDLRTSSGPSSGQDPSDKDMITDTMQALAGFEASSKPGQRPGKPGRRSAFSRPSHAFDVDPPTTGSDRDNFGHHRDSNLQHPNRMDDRIAPELWDNIRENYKSASEFVRNSDFSNARSKHEARRMAHILDALIAGFHRPLTMNSLAIEMLVRNVVGLVEGDRLGNSSILESLEWRAPQEVLPRDMLRSIIKDSKRFDEYRQPSKPASGSASDTKKNGGAGAGRG